MLLELVGLAALLTYDLPTAGRRQGVVHFDLFSGDAIADLVSGISYYSCKYCLLADLVYIGVSEIK